jgi:hypothetical protein
VVWRRFKNLEGLELRTLDMPIDSVVHREYSVGICAQVSICEFMREDPHMSGNIFWLSLAF